MSDNQNKRLPEDSDPTKRKPVKETLYDKIKLSKKQMDIIIILLVIAFFFFFIVGALKGNGII